MKMNINQPSWHARDKMEPMVSSAAGSITLERKKIAKTLIASKP